MTRIELKIVRASWMVIFVMALASMASAQEPQWLDSYEFNQETLTTNGWAEIPGGFETRELGVMQFAALPDQALPSSTDGRGIAITVKPKQVTFLYALNPIAANGRPILLRMTARASSPSTASPRGWNGRSSPASPTSARCSTCRCSAR